MISRRNFLKTLSVAGVLGTGLPKPSAAGPSSQNSSIHRPTLVSRHNPILRQLDPLSPLTVGNGEFAFTADITGLQTLAREYENAMPLCTMSQWGWHTSPAPPDL
ncbi:MAG TPA: twin-arginine translocation signal domain-containing protein, partial [Pyrinomonadaceae bacterium]|nr:twin-arginine translocation signal domain-containing protein [Pyrinomonadaceae bacterium]